MKTNILPFSILLVASLVGFAQPKPRPKDQKVPTQKEIEAMMQEAQRELDGVSVDDKKMLDSLGVQMPSLKSFPTFSDRQITAEANNLYNEFELPAKDIARIVAINKIPLSADELVLYLRSVSAKIEQRMDPERLKIGKEAYSAIKAAHRAPSAVAVAASGYWMMGVLQPAIYLMGRALGEDPKNPDHLNNYAAFLTMAKAEDLALPILIKLNYDYPKNSTILNNLGQAWLGLGDIALAEKFLDSAIFLFPDHSQANYSKALILKANGKTKAAISAMKRSLARGFSDSKKSTLEGMDYELKKNDLQWNLRIPQEALITERYERPDFPKTTNQSLLLKEQWKVFNEGLYRQRDELMAASKTASAKSAEELQNKISSALNHKSIEQLWLSKKAHIMLDHTLSAKSGAMGKLKQQEATLDSAMKIVDELQRTKEQALARVHEEFRPLMGEGKANPFEAYCAKLTAVQNEFLGTANPLLENAYEGYIEAYQKLINEKIYYEQFIYSATDFEGIKLYEKVRWVTVLSNHPVLFEELNMGVCRGTSKPGAGSSGVLAEFNDLHCNTIIDFDIIIARWRKACDKSTVDVGVGPINLKLAYNDWKEEIIRGSIEIGVSKSIGGMSSGPMKAELGSKLAGFAEFDRSGITDVGVVAGFEANAGIEIKTGSDVIESVGSDMVSIGVNTRIGWNSGGSVKVFNN